jgi:hypothetical protein
MALTSAGFIGGGDVRDHQTGRAVFEEAVEAVFFLGGRTPHAVDVGGVMTAEHGFDFAGLPGAVFAIEPDAVVVKVGSDGGEEGDGRAAAADAGDFASAELGEDFGASHVESVLGFEMLGEQQWLMRRHRQRACGGLELRSNAVLVS